MKIIVNPHKLEIEKNPINEKEIDITKCQFEFADEITQDFVKDAYFTFEGTTYQVANIQNNECNIPYEVLEEKGDVEIGVVAYLVEDETEIKRYNPSPAYFSTLIGSLKEQYENYQPITPTDKEQIEQAIVDLQNNKQDLLVSGENIKTINNESLLGSGDIHIDADLSDYVKNTDYAKTSKAGVIKSGYYGLQVDSNNGKAYCDVYTYANYGNVDNQRFISKGTLENVITGKDLTTKSYVDGLVGDIETILTTLDVGGGVNGN